LKKYAIRLSLPVTCTLLTLASLVISVFIFVIRSDTNTDVWGLIIESNGLTLLLNWLPVLLAVFLLFFVIANAIASAGLTALLFIFTAVVNRYMTAMRHEPLQPLTLLLGAEFLGIAKSIKPAVFITVGVCFALFAAAAVFAFKFVKNRKPGWLTRVIGFISCAALCLTLYHTVYESAGIYEALPLQGNYYNEVNQFQSKGFVYSFIHALHNSELTRPPYYNEYLPQIIEAEVNAPLTSDAVDSAKPNIIFVQSEAFSELALSEAVNFDGFTDPLMNYKKIKAESVHGYLVSPHLGGGTSDIEFDVLTGLNTRHFRGVPYAFKMISTPFASIASVLAAHGYETVAMHPGAGWYYTRQNVYPLLGFDAILDDRYYDTTDTKGLYITERQTVEKLIEEYETRESPQFHFCITIQNHGPYDGKYAIDGTNFNAEFEIAEDVRMGLANYFEGLKDSDEGLKRLIDYFKQTDEPVILVYFGDHLPSFPLELLMRLDPLADDAPDGEELLKYNRVPFLIWTNDAAKGLVNTAPFEESLPSDRTISTHYVGAAVLEMIGVTGGPFFDYVNEMRMSYPVILEQTLRPGDEEIRHFDAGLDGPAAFYRAWEYYKVTE
jgi:phosphoglycerol transferase MdoB-like AlkP superfamily enzyme